MCGVDTPLSEVLARMNASPYLFQIVVDEALRLRGTITDGDIRRAMLQGSSLDTPASSCMNGTPRFGRSGAIEANRELLRTLGSSVPFLPLVDQNGKVQEILYGRGGQSIHGALVMAGGFGRRLGERTQSTPKPLVPIGGRPILDHVLTALEDAGVARITIALHYLPEQIKSFVGSRENRAQIQFIEEDTPLGTAGALGKLPTNISEPILVINGDVVTGVNFGALQEFQARRRLDGVIGVTQYIMQVPFGVVKFGEEGQLHSIEEKPIITNFISAGIYYLAPEFISLVPQGRPVDMPELLNLGLGIGLKVGVFPIHEFWADVGRPDDLEVTGEMLERQSIRRPNLSRLS
jgi:dTDP-glucose pyrophosphorylase